MSVRVAAADLGKCQAKLLTGHLEGERVVVDTTRVVAHDGHPLEAFGRWYEQERVAEAKALAATGLYADEIAPPALTGLPEDACLEAALALLPGLVGPLNLVSVGARGYAALVRDSEGRAHYLENDKCSSGTGETMVKTASRFGMTLEEADRLAARAEGSIAITARCSVFAKSEMTHFGNQGEPADRLFRGYFDSIARYVAALLGRARVAGPVYLIGGGSRLVTLRQCLSEQLEAEVGVLDESLVLEAMGALALAGEHARGGHALALPGEASALSRAKERRIRALEPASRWAGRVTRLEAPPVPEGAASRPTVLGLDLGSTGSKAVLTSIETGEIVLDVYDRTRGNPVEAAQRLVRTLSERGVDVRAVGVTGSGREAVATVLRAAFPEAGDRIVVLNEIVAHATAAIRSDPGHGRSLSVVEIGGQDAKFVQIADGQIVESDMNKACSAGTGSFLEEQAGFYGVDDIVEFGRLAASAESPADLGQMCTVFVAEAAAEAHTEGYSVPDLFAGFQYSVVHNYLNRVMGQRTFGERVFFQGKPASGESLAWTLAAVSGREVVVPPNPGAMGAWGIGLAAIEELGRAALDAAAALPVARMLDARIVARNEFRCDDKRCATLCRIERATVAVGAQRQSVFSGGSCPKFEVARSSRPKLPADAPSAFDEREAILAPYFETTTGSREVAVPHVGSLAGWLPWVVTLLREVGLGVRVLRSDAGSLALGEELCSAYDSCAPMKVAHGVGAADVETLFFPRLTELLDREGPPGVTCSTEQGMPVVVERMLRARGRSTRVVAPVVSLAQGYTAPALLFALREAMAELGVELQRLPRALARAGDAQAAYHRQLVAIGRRTLSYGRSLDVPVVVVCGSEHVVFDRTINAGIPGILRQNGVLALPMDCFPIAASVPPLERVVWADARRALRAALAARATGDVYPLWLSSFGCGPSSFVEQLFDHLLHGYPHTCLESDGHGGTAGFVTRIQSFLHGVRQYGRRPAPVPAEKLRLLEPMERRPLAADRDARLVLLSVAGRLSEVAAASYRALGYDARPSGPNTAETMAAGRRDCSGKECLPYQLVWGAFRREIEAAPPQDRTVLVQVTGQGACRNCMFSVKDAISLEHLGVADRVTLRHFGAEDDVRTRYQSRFYAGTVANDVLMQLRAYHLALDPSGEEVGALDRRYGGELVALLERREPEGFRALGAVRESWRELLELMDRAARDYARLEARATSGLRTVLLTGDIYLRIDDFANDDLVASFAERGLRTLVEPVSVLVDYLSLENSDELIGMKQTVLGNLLTSQLTQGIRQAIYDRVLPHHPWLYIPDVPRMLELARPIIDGTPFGEAPIGVGSTLDGWQSRRCDGAVLISPWGCGPGLLTESLLRAEREIPMLFLYSDGSPLDERRLNAFAHRLKRQPRRTRVRAAAAPTRAEARA
ncbi:MAG: hypothetical protein IT376_22235 [Polyangiaceae bacterium]|nr:hypothetical protein [Polyangiaceae bacterium]